MSYIFFGILLICFGTIAAHDGRPLLPAATWQPNQQGLAQLFFSSRVTQKDPLQSMACFADYIAESNDISRNYGSNYNDCLVKASESRKQIDNEAFMQRKGIEISAETVCARMRTCNAHNGTLDMFNCHANMGSNNTKSTYTISGNAAEYATMLQERYRLIELHHEQCSHASQREYVENTAQNYNHLQACLDGRAKPRPPKITTTTSTSTTTTTTTTPKPTTTTPEPTTTTTATETTSVANTDAPPPTESGLRLQQQFAQLLNLLN